MLDDGVKVALQQLALGVVEQEGDLQGGQLVPLGVVRFFPKKKRQLRVASKLVSDKTHFNISCSINPAAYEYASIAPAKSFAA